MTHFKDETQAIQNALGSRMQALCEALGYKNPKREGRELRFGTRGSLAVNLNGIWFDHEAEKGGGPIDLIMSRLGYNFRDARQWALEWLGGSVLLPDVKASPRGSIGKNNSNLKRALRIFDACVEISGTLAETYLQNRAIDLIPPRSTAGFHVGLHFRQNGKRFTAPALVVLVRDVITSEPIGIQRRPLSSQGGKHHLIKKPLSLGRTKGGAIMLSNGPKVNICEGLEDALSLQCLGLDGAFWAVCGTSGLRSLTPVPRVQSIRVIADNDEAGVASAAECVKHWKEAGKGANWQTLGDGDPNDFLFSMKACHD